MEAKEDRQKMRKRNIKLFPIYKMISWDFLFFYTIDFLFLTQIKNIEAADVVLMTDMKSFFIRHIFGTIMKQSGSLGFFQIISIAHCKRNRCEIDTQCMLITFVFQRFFHFFAEMIFLK